MSFQCSFKVYSVEDVAEGDGQSLPCSRSGRGYSEGTYATAIRTFIENLQAESRVDSDAGGW